MYSWGNSYDDYRPKTRAGYSFEDARRSYDLPTSARTCSGRHLLKTPAATNVKVSEASSRTRETVRYTFRDGDIVTESPYPLVVAIDTTGSMKHWPRIIFQKLPLLYAEAQRYLPGCAISFQAINDYLADGAAACFQPAPFGEGPALDQLLQDLRPIGGGGAGFTESYEVAAAWNLVRMKAPMALAKPIVVFLGDEGPSAAIPHEVVRCLGLEDCASTSVFRALHEAAEVFLVRKPYVRARSRIDREITRAWQQVALLRPERILELDDPRRVVDVLLGILGAVSGRQAEFRAELTSRQSSAQSQSVLTTLGGLFDSRVPAGPDESVVRSIHRSILRFFNGTRELV